MAFGSMGMKTVKCVIALEMVGGDWRAIAMIGLYQVRTFNQYSVHLQVSQQSQFWNSPFQNSQFQIRQIPE
jgi:hypothetical protein